MHSMLIRSRSQITAAGVPFDIGGDELVAVPKKAVMVDPKHSTKLFGCRVHKSHKNIGKHFGVTSNIFTELYSEYHVTRES